MFNISIDILTSSPGYIALRITGKDAWKAFQNEIGGHRFQRIPPTEKRGRVHTSTITVAVLKEPSETEIQLDEKDLKWKTCRGSGPGGQHRNTTDSAVQLKHKPSGISIRIESERSQHQNKAKAKMLLRAKLLEQKESSIKNNEDQKRRNQIGSGMRADKRRTVALQRGQVIDHLNKTKMSAEKYLQGYLEELW